MRFLVRTRVAYLVRDTIKKMRMRTRYAKKIASRQKHARTRYAKIFQRTWFASSNFYPRTRFAFFALLPVDVNQVNHMNTSSSNILRLKRSESCSRQGIPRHTHDTLTIHRGQNDSFSIHDTPTTRPRHTQDTLITPTTKPATPKQK